MSSLHADLTVNASRKIERLRLRLSGPLRSWQGLHFGHSGLHDVRMTGSPGDMHTNPLEDYFDSHLEGRGIWKWRHYFEIYQELFARFVGRAPVVLEIGVYSGGSLQMWRDYFGEGTRVIGVDLQQECRVYSDDSTEIYIGDQADPAFWADVCAKEPAIDIVIDDGGHRPHQQIPTFEALIPHLNPGGVYLCEDVLLDDNPFQKYLAALSRNLNVLGDKPNTMQQTVHSVAFYPFICVVRRRETPLQELVSPRHGTRWQPFLDHDIDIGDDGRSPMPSSPGAPSDATPPSP